MSYSAELQTMILYVENHIHDEQMNIEDLQEAIGFSIAHLRKIFKQHTGTSLMRYVSKRKILNSTFDLLYSNQKVIDIAMNYGFENHETYTRAFHRVVGMSPADFRKERLKVGKCELIRGVYGIELLSSMQNRSVVMENVKEKYQDNESTILYGVLKVGYGVYGCTPYPSCLKVCSNYLGEDIDYAYAMVMSGTAFRLTWERNGWNLGNVDVYNAFDESNYVYRVGPTALGRRFEMLERTKDTTKAEFVQFIKAHIDQGYPCIALGIIGPPEACIIAGYRNNGETLLGWNFFQEESQFGGEVKLAENGYYISDDWWENTDTQAVMCMGDVLTEKLPLKELVFNAVTVLTGRSHDIYDKGIKAYDAIISSLLNDADFLPNMNLARLTEQLMCLHDALGCLLDGRGNATGYFNYMAEHYPDHKDLLKKTADSLHVTFTLTQKMVDALGGWSQDEEALHHFQERKTREKLASLLKQAQVSDQETLKILEKLRDVL